MLRRNDVVLVPLERDGTWIYDHHNFYGRVNRRVDSTHVEVICCGRYIQTIPDAAFDQEHANAYDGTWVWGSQFDGHLRQRFPVYRKMSTLRRLKQMASRHNPQVWRKPHGKRWLSYSYAKDAVESAYNKPPRRISEDYRTRFYHDWTHIEMCLSLLDEWPDIGKRKRRVLRDALIWHDIVYEPLSKTNENDSADLYRRYYTGAKSQRFVDEVCRLILLTAKHEVLPRDNIGALMVSIDMAILGTDSEIYDQYAVNIRKEYKAVPLEFYKAGRATVLRKMLSGVIYPDPLAAERWDAQARININRELEALPHLQE